MCSRGGRSRSISIIAGYLMYAKQYSFTETIQYLASKCHRMRINKGFYVQLRYFYYLIHQGNLYDSYRMLFENPAFSPFVQIRIHHPRFGYGSLASSHDHGGFHYPWCHCKECLFHSGVTRRYSPYSQECPFCLAVSDFSFCSLFTSTTMNETRFQQPRLKETVSLRQSTLICSDSDDDELIIPIAKRF